MKLGFGVTRKKDPFRNLNGTGKIEKGNPHNNKKSKSSTVVKCTGREISKIAENPTATI